MAEDYAYLARQGATPEQLAGAFLREYYKDATPAIPVNPFQILRDMGVAFSFRNFVSYEGVYISLEYFGDLPVVGINAGRPITRQRYTAAHELCHHLKDAKQGYICAPGSFDFVERYAESFAAALLMPADLLSEQVAMRAANGKVTLDDALEIANYFGVSFAACVNELAYGLDVLDGATDPASLRQRRSDFGPVARRASLGMDDLVLYRQLYNSGDCYLRVCPTPQTRQIFETEFISQDSRMEGIAIGAERAAEIVVDLRVNGQVSPFCRATNQNEIEVAGLARAYQWVFDTASSEADLTIYDAKEINRLLFSAAVHPEYGGAYRQANPVVVGAGFETLDYRRVGEAMMRKGRELDEFLAASDSLSSSEYIEGVLDLHHDLTVVHPFRDGNGRSLRAFANLLFLRRGLPPVLFSEDAKDRYKDALARADSTGSRVALYELYYREMLKAHAVFTGHLL